MKAVASKRTGALALSAVALLLLAGQVAGAPRLRQPTLSQLVGQHLLVRMQDSTPSASFLARVRRGEIGGVVIFRNNIPASGLAGLIAKLQSAAGAGGQLPLLIAIDQEGGAVRRLPGPPTLAPSAMTSAPIGLAQGIATGRYLHLRRDLEFRGVTLSDDLGTAGVSTRIPPLEAVVRAVQAGIDMVYVAGVGSDDDAIGERAYDACLRRRAFQSLSEWTDSEQNKKPAQCGLFIGAPRFELGNAGA